MIKTIFFISVAVVGLVEWLKNLLPAKVKENNAVLAVISGVVSAVGGCTYVALAKVLLGLEVDPASVSNYLIYGFGTIGCVQVSYNVLLQTFKAVVSKLKAKYSTPVDTEAAADEIVDKVSTTVEEAVTKALEETASKKK